MKVWSKKGEDVPKEVEAYLSGEDILLDQELVFWDALGSIAHAKVLAKAGVLSPSESEKLISGLKKILSLSKQGKFQLKEELEDVHANIEDWLTGELGGLGKKLHTGRSRNDQVALDLALYSKWELLGVCAQTAQLCSKLISLSKKHDCPMPGYTHSRKAMVSSVSHWLLAYCEALLEDLELSLAIINSLDKSPLGAGASFGSIIPLDRELGAKELGFNSIYLNTLNAVGSRGKTAKLVLFALSSIMQDLSAFSSSLILYSDDSHGFVSLPRSHCTGSSIMPHKSNPDCLELIRAKSAKLLGLEVSVAATLHALPLGYHRDLQETKGALMKGFGIAKASLEIMDGMVSGLKIDEKACTSACTSEMCLADFATKMSLEGIPFRDAYKSATISDPKYSYLLDPKKNVSLKTLPGGPGDKLMGAKLEKTLSGLEKKANLKKHYFESSIKKLSGTSP